MTALDQVYDRISQLDTASPLAFVFAAVFAALAGLLLALTPTVLAMASFVASRFL